MAEEVIGEPAITHALKQIDRRLVLQHRPPYYVVVCLVNDHYAPVVATWMDLHGNPLPLSHGLVEKVKAWQIGARNQPEGVDAHNERRQRELQKDRERELEQLRGDHVASIERGQTQVTFARVGKPRYWRREAAAPRSGITPRQ